MLLMKISPASYQRKPPEDHLTRTGLILTARNVSERRCRPGDYDNIIISSQIILRFTISKKLKTNFTLVREMPSCVLTSCVKLSSDTGACRARLRGERRMFTNIFDQHYFKIYPRHCSEEHHAPSSQTSLGLAGRVARTQHRGYQGDREEDCGGAEEEDEGGGGG